MKSPILLALLAPLALAAMPQASSAQKSQATVASAADAPSFQFKATSRVSFEPTFSSSAPALSVPAPASAAVSTPVDKDRTVHTNRRPFRSGAISTKVGIPGIGFDLATPLNSFLNLRGGAQFFDHTANPSANGIRSTGNITFQNVAAMIDIFPFRSNSFHLSPGITLHNDTHLTSSIYVRGGHSFTLGDTTYLSDPSNPIYGDAHLFLGGNYAPRFTIGWGNMLPRRGGHFSVPFDIGFQYISSPTLDLQLHGNACDNQGNCGEINSLDGLQNIHQEVLKLNQQISALRFYPIVSIGFSVSFGH
jgi:hypothetical protein